MVIDNRTVEEKELAKENKHTNTFKRDYQVWEDQPSLIVIEEVRQGGAWANSVHLLEM